MGGNVFADVTPFDHSQIGTIVKQVNKVLSKTGAAAIPIGSTATPTPGKTSGDMDLIVDQSSLATYFKNEDPKQIRKDLRAFFDQAGLQTAQTGVSVHVRIPVKDTAHQVDIMVVPNADTVSKFHIHNIPQGSPYKGKNKQLALSWLAKQKGMKWSAFKGLLSREDDSVISTDVDQIAKLLLNKSAKAEDLGSVESMMNALPPEEAQRMLSELKTDKNWTEIQPSAESKELNRIKELAGLNLLSVRML